FSAVKMPLLIGGATTSRAHTAVKIAPKYDGPVVYVPDASRSVSVMQSLMTPEQRKKYIADLDQDYEKIRLQHGKKKGATYLTLAEARNNKLHLDFNPVKPKFIGRRVFKNIDLAILVPYIDWTPFFQTWDLAGSYPKILEDQVVGKSAKQVFGEAQKMLDKLVKEKKIRANGVVGFFPANSTNDDDIEVYEDDTRSKTLFTYFGLRQQTLKPTINGEQKPNLCLADYIAPKESETNDYIGMFAVTAGEGGEHYESLFEKNHDDYGSIMFKALTDRLAEAFAEYMHERVRTDLWGYASNEKLDKDELIKEVYEGIRPAPGYPACPGHSIKKEIFKALNTAEIGMSLTDNFAMKPASSVSGFYFAHPKAKYFSVDKIDDDQLKDLAIRSSESIELLRAQLAPNIK
ncbi:MAG: vitamin B12 dependent-methionine synthase activation domain-containing protein, partial [Methylophilaceae bacterium]